MKVVFRTDASTRIGFGHLSRCRVLARQLQARGADVLFLCRDLPAALSASLQRAGVPVRALEGGMIAADERRDDPAHASWLAVSQEQDAAECVGVLREAGIVPDWIVVDHYALDARWESRLRGSGARLLAIDDLADREHAVDILLDQNVRADDGAAYHALTPGARLLAGPRYALLRDEFAHSMPRPPSRPARRLFVSFGGSDSGNATGRALKALSDPLLSSLRADIVVSALHPFLSELRAAVAAREGIRLHVDSERIGELMREADIAVGAGGVMTWERCALGLPTVAFPIAANQQAVLTAAAAAGVLLAPDPACLQEPACLAAQLRALADNAVLRATLSARAQSACDGRGAERVARILVTPGVTVRPAGEADRQRIFEWRNHPDVRKTSFDAGPIPADVHDRWFARVLDDPARALLVGEQDGKPIGVLRYDVDGAEANVSIFLDPSRTGAGLGGALLQAGEAWLEAARPEVRSLRADVRSGNAASERLFGGAGFESAYSVWRRELPRRQGGNSNE